MTCDDPIQSSGRDRHSTDSGNPNGSNGTHVNGHVGSSTSMQPPIVASIGSVLIDVFDVVQVPKSLADLESSLESAVRSIAGAASTSDSTYSSGIPLTPQQSFEFLNQPHLGETYDQIGGGAVYALIGSRLWLPAERLKTIADRSLPDKDGKDDLSEEVEERLNVFGEEIWVWNRDEHTRMTRSRIRYQGDVRYYQSLVKAPYRTIAQLSASPLNGAEYLHIGPPYSSEDVATLLSQIETLNSAELKRANGDVNIVNGDSHSIGSTGAAEPELKLPNEGSSTSGSWHPKIVFEPSPFSCHPGQLKWLEKILPGIEVLSPNHEELFSFYSLPNLSLSDPKFKSTVERLVYHIVQDLGIGVDGKGIVVVRCGSLGACAGTKAGGVRWCPAFFDGQDKGRVKDVTGAGNSFLGGYIAGLSLTNDPYEALLYGAVSSSFVCEQFGLPTLSYRSDNGEEEWNGDSPRRRLDQLRKRLDS